MTNKLPFSESFLVAMGGGTFAFLGAVLIFLRRSRCTSIKCCCIEIEQVPMTAQEMAADERGFFVLQSPIGKAKTRGGSLELPVSPSAIRTDSIAIPIVPPRQYIRVPAQISILETSSEAHKDLP